MCLRQSECRVEWFCSSACSAFGLHYSAQAQLASAPKEIIVASLSSMRASAIRKKVRERRKVCTSAWVLVDVHVLRTWASCWTTCASMWMNLAVALCQKLLSRHLLSWKRLAAFLGPNASQRRRSKFVNQATCDLEVGAPPTRKAPLLPL